MTGLTVTAERAQQRLADGLENNEQDEADPQRDPQGLRRQPGRPILLAGAGRTRHNRRRPVGQEVEDRERAREDDPGEAEGCDLRAAEVAHDRGVYEDIERLCGQRAQRRQREVEDLPVVW